MVRVRRWEGMVGVVWGEGWRGVVGLGGWGGWMDGFVAAWLMDGAFGTQLGWGTRRVYARRWSRRVSARLVSGEQLHDADAVSAEDGMCRVWEGTCVGTSRSLLTLRWGPVCV